MKLKRKISAYFNDLYNLHCKYVESFINEILRKLSPKDACYLKNIIQKIGGRKTYFSFDEVNNMYCCSEGCQQHYFSNRDRGFYLFSKGLKNRINDLGESYFIDRIKFDGDSVIIDCGANSGELYAYLRKIISPGNYHFFEPSPTDFQSVLLNTGKVFGNMEALYSSEEDLKLHLAVSRGDSSILEPQKGFDEIIPIKATTLDKYVSLHSIKSIRLFKVEAEGLEPEVLVGAQKSLPMIDYICLDGGEERGLAANETLSTCSNILFANGFVIDFLSLRTSRVLFRNSSRVHDSNNRHDS